MNAIRDSDNIMRYKVRKKSEDYGRRGRRREGTKDGKLHDMVNGR